MSENEIKPVAWIELGGDAPPHVRWVDGETAIYDREGAKLYDQSAIDRLTEERDALRSQLDWVVRENDRLLDEGRYSAAERDAAVADAERYRWIRLRIGGREAVEDDFKWEYESGECLAQEVDSAIDAARSEAK